MSPTHWRDDGLSRRVIRWINAGQKFEGIAQRIRQEFTERIRLHLSAIWACGLMMGVTTSALLYALLFESAEKNMLTVLFCWLSLGLVLGVTVVGWWRSMRREHVGNLLRENLFASYQDSHNDLEVWLSRELIGENAEIVRRFAEMQLDRRLARQRGRTLAVGYFPAMLTLTGATLLLVLAHVLTGSNPWSCADRYFHGFSWLESTAPPEITSISPAQRWVTAAELEGFEVAFAQPLTAAAFVRVHAAGEASSHELVKVAEASYRAPLGESPRHFTLEITVGEWTSKRINYDLYPARPVEVTAIRVSDPAGLSTRDLDLASNAHTVSEGTRIEFHLEVAECPLVIFGIGGSGASEELGLNKNTSGHYSGTTRLFREETFRVYWQHPGAAATLGPEFIFRVKSEPTPEVQLLLPVDGALVEDDHLDVVVRCGFSGAIHKGYLLGADFHGMQWAWELPLARRDDGWTATARLPLNFLKGVSGQVIGLCATAQSASSVPRIGFSEVVTIRLPAGLDVHLAGLDDLVPAAEQRLLDLESLERMLVGQEIDRCPNCGGQLSTATGKCQACGNCAGCGSASCDGGCGAGDATSGGGKRVGVNTRMSARGSGGAGSNPGGGSGNLDKLGQFEGQSGEGRFGKPPPPRFQGRGLAQKSGRKARAKKVDESLADLPGPPPPGDEEKVALTAGDSEVDETGGHIKSALTRGRPPRARQHPDRKLTASEIEKRLSRFAEFMDRLTPEERRRVREFHRELRDLK